jgi:hypothetical protein
MMLLSVVIDLGPDATEERVHRFLLGGQGSLSPHRGRLQQGAKNQLHQKALSRRLGWRHLFPLHRSVERPRARASGHRHHEGCPGHPRQREESEAGDLLCYLRVRGSEVITPSSRKRI